jgi:hypothetical protein
MPAPIPSAGASGYLNGGLAALPHSILPFAATAKTPLLWPRTQRSRWSTRRLRHAADSHGGAGRAVTRPGNSSPRGRRG